MLYLLVYLLLRRRLFCMVEVVIVENVEVVGVLVVCEIV